MTTDPRRKANALHSVNVMQAAADVLSALGSYLAHDGDDDDQFLNIALLLLISLIANAERELKNMALASHDLGPFAEPVVCREKE